MRWALVVFAVAWTTVACLGCPLKCECHQQMVNCRGATLHSVPDGIPLGTVHLDLRDNAIRHIQRKDIQELRLLQSLLVSNNLIQSLQENLFDELPSLKKFSASRNQLAWLPRLFSSDHKELLHFDVHSNRIRGVDPSLFTHSPHLRTVNLAHNQLQSLPIRVIERAPHLHAVHLDENPINCDCRWRGNVAFLKALPRFDETKCLYPLSLRGEAMTSLNGADFHCFPSTPVRLPRGVILECSREGRDVVWIYNGLEMKESYTGDFELFANGSVRIDSFADTNAFECAVDYVLAPSRKLRQLRGSSPLPHFTLRPKDRSFREGTSARLDCEVSGKPRPTIKWYFKDKELKRSRKYEMNVEQTTLNIYPFLERDVGTYKCVAENAFGRVEASASADLLSSSPPVIVDGPSPRTVPVGASVVFKCKATAEPRPFITWFFDGSEIPMIRGHFQVSDDQTELSITEVSRRDDGVYSCMAGNTVGSMTAEARLTVTSEQQRLVDERITDEVIQRSVQQATLNVDRAIEAKRVELSKATSPKELMKWLHFSLPQTIELNRAREIYEESIRLVQKHVEKGLSLPMKELPSNVSFESVLANSHVDALTQLSGCSGAQNRDPCDSHCFHSRYRTYDGQCNNVNHPMWGASHMRFRRILRPIYENGFNTPVGWDPEKLYFGFRKPNPRTISRRLMQTRIITPHEAYSSMLMQWGQFIDHDLDFVATAVSRNAFATGAVCNRTCENINPCFNVQLPVGDPRYFSRPEFPCIEFERSSAVCGSGETSLIYRQVTYREQMNIITSYIDASGVYGSTEEDAYELRDFHPDKGLLRFDIVSEAHKPYLPFERDSPMDCRRNYSVENPIRCFLAGDYRANEQVGLISMHTLFMREHNRIANALESLNPDLDGETIFQEARKIVGAQLQHITFHHWLPKVLGQKGFDRYIGPYRGYRSELDASVSNAFATAAFRFGHTLINPILLRLDEEFKPIRQGHVLLRDAFFSPETVLSGGGIDPLLRGLFASPMKKPLPQQLLNTELTEQLFNRAHEVALDLAVMNIQRARDHGIPGYTEYRKWCNLGSVNRWEDLEVDIPRDLIPKLRELYGHPGNVDLFVGGIMEERRNGSLVGPTFACIIADQFRRVRDGDRFWYEKEGVFTDAQLNAIKRHTLSRIICDNSDSINRVQADIFFFPGPSKEFYGGCAALPQLDLSPWQNCCSHLCSIANNRYRNSHRRRRRSHKRHCVMNGRKLRDGQSVRDGCTRCSCKNGKVWCSVIAEC